MPVHLFTWHAYPSWLPDQRRGFVQEGQGIQPSNKRLANAYRAAAKHPSIVFDAATQLRLIQNAKSVCAGDGHRLHGAATEPTHLHAVVSWRDEAVAFEKVRERIKNLLSLDLSRRAGITGRPWFSKGGSRKRVGDEKHLRYLLETYLPKHVGVGWYEDRGWANLAPGVDPDGGIDDLALG